MNPTTVFTHGFQYIYETRAEAGGPVVQIANGVDRYAPNLTARCSYFFQLIAEHYHRDLETLAGVVNDAALMTTFIACAKARAYSPGDPPNDMLARSLASSLPTAAQRATYIGRSPLRLHAWSTFHMLNTHADDHKCASLFSATTGIFVYHEHARILAALAIAANSGEVMLLNGRGRAKPAEIINEHELLARRPDSSPTF